MLSEELVNRIALLVSVAGVALLFSVSVMFAAEKVKIAEISEEMVGRNVLVEGKVEWKVEKENFILFGLNDGNEIKVIIFSPSAEQREAVRENSFLLVEGKVQIYQNELEIIAGRVQIVD